MKVRPDRKSGEVIMEVNQRDETLLTGALAAPFRLKRILVPVDFSDCAKKALRYAIPFAELHQAEIVLLYVSPSSTYVGGEYGMIDVTALDADLRVNGEKRLKDFATEEVPAKLASQTVVCSGSPTTEIVDLAEKLPADLIVISTHGYSGLKHVLLGSVAEHVVRHAPCPVLVVRENEHEFLT